MKGSTASERGCSSPFSQRLNVGRRPCRSVLLLRRRRVWRRNEVRRLVLCAWYLYFDDKRNVHALAPNNKVPSTKYQALRLYGRFLVDLVRDGTQDQRHFRIAHLRRFKTNLNIEVAFG